MLAGSVPAIKRKTWKSYNGSVTAGEGRGGVRPSSGAAMLESGREIMKSGASPRPGLAAPEDGRTPIASSPPSLTHYEPVDACEGSCHALCSRMKPSSSQEQTRCQRVARVMLRGCLRIPFVFSSYSLRILFVFSSYSLGVRLLFPGGPLRHSPAAAPSDYFVLTAKGSPFFKRNRISTSTWCRSPLGHAAGIPGRTCARGRRPLRWHTRRLPPVRLA